MFIQLFTLLLPLLVLAHYYRGRVRYDHHHHRRAASQELPSPFKLPIIGNLHQLGPLLHRSLSDMSRVHGPLMLLRFGSRPVLVVSSADTAQEVMKVNDLAFASRPSITAAKEMTYNCADVAFAPYGEYWRQAKKLCTVHLLSAKRVQSYATARAEEVTAMVAKIAKWSASSTGPVNLSSILNSFANDVVTRVAVGRKYTGGGEWERNTFCEMTEEVSALFASFDVADCFPWLGWLGAATVARTRMKQCFRRLDAFLDQVIQDHLNDGCRKDSSGDADLVDVLLSLQSDQDAATSLSRDSMKAIILDMFTAGTDTTYITLEWAMAELVRNPEVMEKVQGEVRAVAKGEHAMITEDELSQMPYLEAVIKEVLRLHPPAPLLLPRESTCAARVGGHEIPAKTRVLVNAWAIARDPECWEAPEEFRPERFVDSPVDFRGQDFRYIPFGAGRRICPGISFASSTTKLALANLLRRFEWELPDGMRAEDLDMAEALGITTRKKSDLLLVAMPRAP